MVRDILAFSEAEEAEYAKWTLDLGIGLNRAVTDEDFLCLSEGLREKLLLILARSELPDVREQSCVPEKTSAKQVSFGKAVSKFWKKHKTEIIVGSAIVAVITTVAIVAITSGGTAAGVAVAAGSAAISGLRESRDQDAPRNSNKAINPSPPPSIALPSDYDFIGKPPPSGSVWNPPPDLLPIPQPPSWMPPPGTIRDFPSGPLDALAVPQVPIQGMSFEKAPTSFNMDAVGPPPSPVVQPGFFERNLPVFSSSDKALSKSWPQWASEMVGLSDEEKLPSPPQNNFSMTFTTKGERNPALQIMGVNGIDNSLEDAVKHAEYLEQGARGKAVDWVYNHSNSPLMDVAEVVILNIPGSSPNTGKLLQENWVAFHEQNKDNPNAKCLQFCHSQGAIHVRNGLASAPEEIRDRVIVVAIAPAAIISDDICYQSFNYASKSDLVPKAELVVAGFFDTGETAASERVQAALTKQGQLILLDPHPDATGIDHDFQSPTFYEYIKRHLDSYFEKNGEFE